MELVDRFFRPPDGNFFLFGPRGTGKSTWLRRNLGGAPYVDLLDAETFRSYSARPERLRELVEASPDSRNVIIDEIQKAPKLLDTVHQMMEQKRGWRFVLTGSSSRKLKRAGVDLLAGRAIRKTLHPFMAAELGERFDLGESLKLGLLPLVLGAPDPAQTLSSYAALYVREEVQAEGLVRNIGSFSRFLEAVSFSHASVLNTSAVARDCHVNRKTVEGFIAILEDLLLGFRLPVFTKRAKRKLIRHPKFYFADTGIFRSLRAVGPLDAPEEIGGGALEGLVAQHLRAWTAYSDQRSALYFWRTKSGLEIDFVVYGPDTFLAVEVKGSAAVHTRDVRALQAFAADYPGADLCLLYQGSERLMVGGVRCVPCEEFLKELVPNSPPLGI